MKNLTLLAGASLLVALIIAQRIQAAESVAHPDGTVHAPAYDLPLSTYMSEEAKRSVIENMIATSDVDLRDANLSIEEQRRAVNQSFFEPLLKRARMRYEVNIEERKIAGVPTATVTPKDGVVERHRHRVLINLHCGGFTMGAGIAGLIESIPIAATSGLRVVSVDYRLAPENQFPAANEDVAAVYKELLKHYQPENIGIFGCSAGGLLTAESIAWFQQEKLPRPGAIGVFCSGGDARLGGDSRYIPTSGTSQRAVEGMLASYFKDANLDDPLISPVFSPKVLAGFPPTLIITGTRAQELSSAVYTHSQLIKAGAQADLHVWEGMSHGFLLDVGLPESQEAFNVIVRFFDQQLGGSAAASK